MSGLRYNWLVGQEIPHQGPPRSKRSALHQLAPIVPALEQASPQYPGSKKRMLDHGRWCRNSSWVVPPVRLIPPYIRNLAQRSALPRGGRSLPTKDDGAPMQGAGDNPRTTSRTAHHTSLRRYLPCTHRSFAHLPIVEHSATRTLAIRHPRCPALCTGRRKTFRRDLRRNPWPRTRPSAWRH
jgi:hypothetical protein